MTHYVDVSPAIHALTVVLTEARNAGRMEGFEQAADIAREREWLSRNDLAKALDEKAQEARDQLSKPAWTVIPGDAAQTKG